jgi:hypothetical protein
MQTQLMWMRCALGQTWNGTTCVGQASKMNWEEACQQKSSFAGYKDWRMPTIEELRTLVDTNQSGAKIHPQAFPNCPADRYWFWSGSPYANNSGYAWGMDFNDGNGGISNRNDNCHVRLVRGGR